MFFTRYEKKNIVDYFLEKFALQIMFSSRLCVYLYIYQGKVYSAYSILIQVIFFVLLLLYEILVTILNITLQQLQQQKLF